MRLCSHQPKVCFLPLTLLITGLACSIAFSTAASVTVSISPSVAYVVPSFDQQFALMVSGATNPAVTWSVNNIVNGNATVGTITTGGHYVAPPGGAVGTSVTVRATSVQDSTAVGVATVYFINPVATITGLNPSSMPVGPFTLQVSGTNFVNGSVILWNGTALGTTFVSKNSLRATGNAAAAGKVSITVYNPGSLTSAAATLTVTDGGGSPPPPPPPPPPAISVQVTPGSAGIVAGGTQQFTAVVNNSSNQTVSWNVNGTPGGDNGTGLISASGLYTAPMTVPSPNVMTIRAVAAADGTSSGSATVTIKNPQAVTLGRFLDQATYGSTPSLTAHVQQIGMGAFITEQFNTPESAWPALSSDRNAAIDAFYSNAGNGQDQLRQRVIGVLSEIIVEALNKETNGDEIIPWLQILSKDAFGNYRQLLRDITLDASMGHYLDLANSNVQGGAPNENYPREVMQLFSIGVSQLNQDGSTVLDGNGQPVPTFSQTDVQQMARALTGWTYPNASNTTNSGGNGAYYAGTMLPVPGAHLGGSKTILGQTIPAGQTASQDVDSAINILMNHPNIAPFIATRLIRGLVTSNPSPTYINAVADKFVDNGSGVRGDMQAVIREVLMNAEARNDNPPSNFGRLRNPMQYILSVSRALGFSIGGASGFNYLLYQMNFGLLDPASVFGHYSPLFKVPQTGGLFGPEFQIYSASDAVNRANFMYSKLYVYPSNPQIASFVSLAGNPQALIDSVDNALLYGRMSQTLRAAIANSLAAMPDDNQRAIEALYLTMMSGEYLVQR